jgi:hypothetical protein
VEYGYSRVAGTVIISDQEQDENSGAAAIFKLMKEKMNVLEESIKEKFSHTCTLWVVALILWALDSLIPTNPLLAHCWWINRATQPSGALLLTTLLVAWTARTSRKCSMTS